MRTALTGLMMLVAIGFCHGQTDSLRKESHFYYLADIQLRTVARWILNDSIAPSDNYVTFRCMDSLTSKNRKSRDYFFPVFTKIVEKADGALAEVVGGCALSYVKKYPREWAERYKNCSLKQPCYEELQKFAEYVGTEIMMSDHDQQAYDDFLNAMTMNFKNWRTNKAIKSLVEKVDEVRKSW